MNELGVQPYVVESILNHTMSGVMAVYNRYQYLNESVDALNLWGRQLQEVIRNK